MKNNKFISKLKFLAIASILCIVSESSIGSGASPVSEEQHLASKKGIIFSCDAAASPQFHGAVLSYFHSQGIPSGLVSIVPQGSGVSFVLASPLGLSSPLRLSAHPSFQIPKEKVFLPTASGVHRSVETVSKKEIILAMLFPTRGTEFTGSACSLKSLQEHVGVRQNTVAWAERLSWGWPNGGSAQWNEKLWARGTPKGHPAWRAINDAFLAQKKYAIGCYTAAKLVMAQGVLDYYKRVAPDAEKLRRLEAALWRDGDPLVNIESPAMWSFEAEFNEKDRDIEGKLVELVPVLDGQNFIPGDWAYFLNTDPESANKTGYEGSNAIYLGRNLFDDFYKDHHHQYSFEEKVHEVYQWRNGVFSRSRDANKLQRIDFSAFSGLATSPEAGGVVIPLRAAPYKIY